MTYLPRLAATTTEWADLADELDRWGEAGRVARLWWRDDDAVAPSVELDRLLRLAGDTPLALAVIPQPADPRLAAALSGWRNVGVVQHGWRHANHGGAGKKSEFPANRAAEEVAADLAAGAARLAELFGPRFVPILAPPWNRFAAQHLGLLAPAGLAGLSAMAARPERAAPDAVVRADVHVDLVAWKSGRGFIGAAMALDLLVSQLRACRNGVDDPQSATGILTHHLVMYGATGAFLERLLSVVAAHPAARWVSAAELVPRR